MDSTDPADELGQAMVRVRDRLQAGVSPYTIAEEFFEAAAVPISRLRAPGPLQNEAQTLVREAVEVLLTCGRQQFAIDNESARKLGQILSWARHFAGTLPSDAVLESTLEELNRTWHWRTLG